MIYHSGIKFELKEKRLTVINFIGLLDTSYMAAVSVKGKGAKKHFCRDVFLKA